MLFVIKPKTHRPKRALNFISKNIKSREFKEIRQNMLCKHLYYKRSQKFSEPNPYSAGIKLFKFGRKTIRVFCLFCYFILNVRFFSYFCLVTAFITYFKNYILNFFAFSHTLSHLKIKFRQFLACRASETSEICV